MDGDDLMSWVSAALACFILALLYAYMFCIIVSKVAACIQRWRGRRDKLLAVDRLLESVDDVPYQLLPPADDDDHVEGSAPWCVVCLAEYEHGERCFVLPGCVHTFHRDCIAPWLRQASNTCPICRATVIVAGPAEHHTINTAENMV